VARADAGPDPYTPPDIPAEIVVCRQWEGS
jgi:hypothetical protein